MSPDGPTVDRGATVPLGVACEGCGVELTVDYVAHGTGNAEVLVSDAMRELVRAAALRAIDGKDIPRRCSSCDA